MLYSYLESVISKFKTGLRISNFILCLIASLVLPFVVIYKRLISNLIPSRRGIVAREVPVAQVVRTGQMKVFNGLVDNPD